ncbi:MAG TPA: hypothetical protein VGS60_03585 [Actinomycetes bacterium]|nr:hypothetical protein [Actinomycetes bacterium]
MSGRSLLWPLFLLGTVTCGEAGTSLGERVPTASVSGVTYALRSVAGQALPQPTTQANGAPSYLADTIRFDIAYAANVPGPLALTRTVYRASGGGRDTVVVIVRYAQDADRLSFPPLCVPSKQCPTRFLEGRLESSSLTLEVPLPLRGPLRYERVLR